MNGTTNAIFFGDRVSICCERANHFLSSTGVADARLVLSEPGAPGSPMLNFERSIFALEKVKLTVGYTAPGHNSAMQQQHSLQTSADYLPTPAVQEPIMFGNIVQLRHVYSGRYVTVARTRRAESRGSLHVALEPPTAENALATHFRVMPRYKIRQEGEKINGGDHLVLFNELLRVHLSLDAAGQEAIGSATMESFSFYVIDSADSKHQGSLRLLSSVLLFHKEQESFFQLLPSHDPLCHHDSAERDADAGHDAVDVPHSGAVLVHPHIRDSTYNIASLDFSGNALWIVESMQCIEGGIVTTNDHYRIKHCASGKYIAASMVDGEQLIGVDRPVEGDASAWHFMPCDPTERLIQSGTTFFRIQNVRTGSWIHTRSTHTALSLTAPKSLMSRTLSLVMGPRSDEAELLEAAPHRSSNRLIAAHYTGQLTSIQTGDASAKVSGAVSLVERPAYVDVFCAVSAPYVAERDVHRVLGYRSLLMQLVQRLESCLSNPSSSPLALAPQMRLSEFIEDAPFLGKVRMCINDLIPFCFNSSTAADSDPTNMAPIVSNNASARDKPHTSHQKMLIDQNVHIIVVDILALVQRTEDWCDFPAVVQIVGQLFRFLTSVVTDNTVGCGVVYRHLPLFLPFLDRLPAACGIFAQVAKCKPLGTSLLQDLLRIVVPQLSASKYNDAYFSLLQDICIAGGNINAEHQKLIFGALLASGSMPRVYMKHDRPMVSCAALLHRSTRSTSPAVYDASTSSTDTLNETMAGSQDEGQSEEGDIETPVDMIDDNMSPVARFCAGAWALLGRCTVGCTYPPLAWVEVDHIVPLLEATSRVPLLRKAVVAVARSVFLADVDAHEPQHPQLWSWKYRLGEGDERPTMTQIQILIMKSTLEMMRSVISSGEGLRSKTQGDLLNELLQLWNSVVISHCYNEEWAERLATIIDECFTAVAQVWRVGGNNGLSSTSLLPTDSAGDAPFAAPEERDFVIQAVYHVLNILQSMLRDSATQSAKEIRHIIRPQLHEETNDSTQVLANVVRNKAHSPLLCRKAWLPHLLMFAASQTPRVAASALECIFNVLSLSRLALEQIESSLVFSEGYEKILGGLLDVAHIISKERFSLAGIPRYEALLQQLLAIIRRSFSSDVSTTLDAQNVLHFAGVHSSICHFIDHAQRASVAQHILGTVEAGMELLHFMGHRNSDVAADMVQHLPALCLMSTTCQYSTHYFLVLATTFTAAEAHTSVDVTKLVNDIFQSEQLTEASLHVVLAALRCPSEKIRANARDAMVGAISAMNFEEGVPAECKPLFLEILCECATREAREAIARYVSVSDILSICPTSKAFLANAVGVRDVFEVCCRCVTLLFLKGYSDGGSDDESSGAASEAGTSSGNSRATPSSSSALKRSGDEMLWPNLQREEAELLKLKVLDMAVEVSVTSQLHFIPAALFDALTWMMQRDEFRPLFLASIRKLASYVLNHCETSVNTKFQLECKDPLLRFFERAEVYILPDSLPNIAVVRRRLQRISVHPDKMANGTSTSSISGHWARLRRDLGNELREPSESDLSALVDMLREGTTEARRIIEMFVGHLRTSDLPSWVSVSMLLCLRYMLERAEVIGEREMVLTQNLLNQCRATPLLSTLLEKPNLDVVRHAVRFGISLLEGGNKLCQDALLNYFKTHDEKFFLTIRKYIKLAQAEANSRSPSTEAGSTMPDGSFSVLAQDLCRLMQLLCEGHHFAFQNYVRHQNDNFNSYNMCILVMELLHTLLLRMDSAAMPIAVQALNTLTEFCQGPCQDNQAAIVGCNVVAEVNRVLTIRDSELFDEEAVMEMKQASIVLLLSLLEGNQDGAIPNLILTHIDTSALHALVEQVWNDAFVHTSIGKNERVISAIHARPDLSKDGVDELLELGFNIFILAKILTTQGDKHRSDHLLGVLTDTAGYEYFNQSICNIEIWRDDDPESLRLETVYFRKPEICRLREETKETVMNFVDRSSLVSKHSDFCKCADDLIFEMEFQFQIEEAARSLPKWFRIVTFDLATCRPRPVEDVLLLLSLTSNLLVVSGFTDRQGPIHWGASVAFFVVGTLQFFCCVYLIIVHLVLSLPRLAHRSLKKGETDPFLSIKMWGEKFRHVTTSQRMFRVLRESYSVAFIVFLVASLLAVLVSPFFNTCLLAMVTFKAPLLANIVKAITMNGRQLMLTAFLGVISVYFFSVIGFLFFYEHFERGDEGDGIKKSNCETLLQCFFFSFGQGVRGGGGIGEELKSNHWEDGDFFRREMYDTLFFVIVAVIVMNIVFALIVDTFAELRDARKKVEDDMRTTCFVCGIDAATFDREGEGFGPHTKGPHNVWQYLYFLHHLRRKASTEFTGQESYVAFKVKKLDLSFFPVNRSKSLMKASNTAGGEKDEFKDDSAGPEVAAGPTLAALRKAMKEVVEEQLAKALRGTVLAGAANNGTNATSNGAGGQSSTGTASNGAGTGTSSRATSLWAKARTQRGSIVRSYGGAPRGTNGSGVGQNAVGGLVSTPPATSSPNVPSVTPPHQRTGNNSFYDGGDNVSFNGMDSLASTMNDAHNLSTLQGTPEGLSFAGCMETAGNARNMLAAIRELIEHERL